MSITKRYLVKAAPAGGLATNDIRGIKPPVEIYSGWVWVWALLLALLAAGLAYYLWRQWRRPPLTKEPIPSLPPDARARQKLKDALALIDQPKPFIIAVSDTIRAYLEERFDLRAPERTTEEFLFELQSSAVLMEAHKDTLRNFLQRCDLVKFARYEPVRVELQEIYEAAIRLVEETRPQPDPPPAVNEAEKPAAALTP